MKPNIKERGLNLSKTSGEVQFHMYRFISKTEFARGLNLSFHVKALTRRKREKKSFRDSSKLTL